MGRTKIVGPCRMKKHENKAGLVTDRYGDRRAGAICLTREGQPDVLCGQLLITCKVKSATHHRACLKSQV